MAGHVAQFFIVNESWNKPLQSIYRALNPSGHVAFESRNPLVQPFIGWLTKLNRRELADQSAGRFEWWSEALRWSQNLLSYELY